MRFDEVVRRLEPLPARLPEAPAALLPVIVDDAGVRPRPSWPAPDGTSRPAAVLVLLYPDDAGEARVILTERTDLGGHHSGEVSFPGGRAEPHDADIVATALRENSGVMRLNQGWKYSWIFTISSAVARSLA